MTAFRRTMLAALAFGTAPAAWIAPAAAQDTTPSLQSDSDRVADSVAEGDIVVTARRREETLLDVPIAVSAFSGAALEARGAIDVTDVGNFTPNVTLEVSRGTNSTLTAFIRGVGQQDPVAGFEAGVGIYLDDVYLNRPQAAVLDIYDVERIEVLRGPQGTLYGRNTIGGAVKYVTRRLADEFTFSARGSYGSYDQADGVVSVSAPITSDGTVKLGSAFARLSRGGFGTNLTTGQENYNKDIWGGRLTLQVEPSSSVFIRLSGDYTRDKSNPRGGHRLIPDLAAPVTFPVLSDVFDSRGGLIDPRQDVEAYGGSLFAEVKPADWLTFRSITGYRKDDSASPIDFDALPAVDVDVPAFYNNKQFSQEVQALVNTGGLNLLMGLYYLDADARTVFDVRTPGRVTALTFGNVVTDTVAVFGDATYDFTRQFSVSVGGRYTWDTRRSQVQRNVYLGSSPFFGGNTAPILRQTDFSGSADFQKFTPRASLSFKPTQDHLLYASYSKGFKGGGFDPRGVGISAPDLNGNGVAGNADPADVYQFLSFDPETVDSYEIGYKGALFDRRLTLAIAAFHSRYSDVQIPGSIGVIAGGVQSFAGITTNAARAQINGIEGELNAQLYRSDAGVLVSFAGTVGYLDAKYKEYIDARGIDVSARRRFQNTPDWTANGTLSLAAPIGDGTFAINTTVSYRGDSQQFELRTPGLDQSAFALWDASASYTFGPGSRYSISAHGKNLTNKEYVVAGYNFLRQNPDTGDFILANGQPGLSSTLGAEGVLTAYYGNPRQVWVSAGLKF